MISDLTDVLLRLNHLIDCHVEHGKKRRVTFAGTLETEPLVRAKRLRERMAAGAHGYGGL